MPRGRMFVVTLRKGGVGKTTVAMNLAIYLRQQGREWPTWTSIPSGTASSSSRTGAACTRISRRSPTLPWRIPTGWRAPMRSVAKACGDAVVDCPPLDPPQVVRAQEVGDILLFPFKPGGNDLRAFSRALSLYQAKREQAGTNGHARPQMFALINEFMRGQLNDGCCSSGSRSPGSSPSPGCLGRASSSRTPSPSARPSGNTRPIRNPPRKRSPSARPSHRRDPMKPKRPTETDLLAIVQNGFQEQLPKDREARAPARRLPPTPTPIPGGWSRTIGTHGQDHPSPSPRTCATA